MAGTVFLNPNDMPTGMALSTDKLTISEFKVTNYGFARANRGLDVGYGKYYFEVTIGPTLNATQVFCGIAGAKSANVGAITAIGLAGTSTLVLGTAYCYPTQVGHGLGTPAVNNTYGIAVDCVNKRMYFRLKTDANWGSYPPSGVDFATEGWSWSSIPDTVVYPCVGVYGNVGAATCATPTVNFGATPFVFTVPDGYLAVDPCVKLLCRTEDGNLYNFSGSGWTQIGNGEPTQAMFDSAMSWLPSIANCKALANKYEVLVSKVGGGVPDAARKMRVACKHVLGNGHGSTLSLSRTPLQTAPPTPTLTYDTITQQAPVQLEVNGNIVVPYGLPMFLDNINCSVPIDQLNVGANNGVIKVKFGGTEEQIPFTITKDAPGRATTERTFKNSDGGYVKTPRTTKSTTTSNISLNGYAGINTVTVTYTGNPKFAVSFDGGATWQIRAASTSNQNDLLCDFLASDSGNFTRPETYVYDGSLKPGVSTTLTGVPEANFSRYVLNADNYKAVL